MRARARTDGLSVQAIAGSHVVLFGIDVPAADADGLLGFTITRIGSGDGAGRPLPNFLRFEANKDKSGPGLSDENPIQAFVWGDYTVDPGTPLRYRIEARYGEPGELETHHAVAVDVQTEQEDDGSHGIWFNRGAAGSQAFAEHFPNVDIRTDRAAQQWLSRGLEEALLRFIGRAAGPGFALRGAFYEFSHASVLDALAQAAQRGVDVKLVVARPHDPATGAEKSPSQENVPAVAAHGLDGVVTWRERSVAIPHNKFLVLLEQDKPVAVWTGSTNITDGALWGHSNVGHLAHETDAANVGEAYLAYWTALSGDPETDALRQLDDTANPIPTGAPPDKAVTVLFSPHTGARGLDWLAERMAAAQQAAFFTAPFGISAPFENVLNAPHSFAVYALLDKPDNHMTLLRGNPENRIVSGAFLPGPWHQFRPEHLIGLNPNVPFVHTKYLLVDPLGDDPLVVSGSANFSVPSIASNDENLLVVRGDTRVADIYLSEFMRLFTHMWFRARTTDAQGGVAAPTPEQRAPADATPADGVLYLKADDSWTKPWYDPADARCQERELFRAPTAGAVTPPSPRAAPAG